MDFLLECIGFPPGSDLGALAERIRNEGETVALRGPRGEHRRLALCAGLEVRLDREEGQEHDRLWPYYDAPRRLRVRVETLQGIPDSPFDVVLRGRANPAHPDDPWREAAGDEYPLAAYLWDARRLPGGLPRGHVLAISLAGFALDVSFVGPNRGVQSDYLRDEPGGASLLPIEGRDQPDGCMEVSLLVREIHHLENPLTRERIERVVADAPGRSLDLFLSRWQLEAHGLEAPRPGWRIEGAFLFHGRASGGLPRGGARRRPG